MSPIPAFATRLQAAGTTQLGGGAFYSNFAILKEDAASHKTYTGGAAYVTVRYNVVNADPGSIVSLNATTYVITLQAGNYILHFVEGLATRMDRHKTRVYNVSDSANAVTGSSGWCGSGTDLSGRYSNGGLETMVHLSVPSTKDYRIETRGARGSDGGDSDMYNCPDGLDNSHSELVIYKLK